MAACPLLITYEVDNPPSGQDLQKLLEKGTITERIDALKTLILMIMQDDSYPRLMMHVIRFCIQSDNHEIKKLLLLYWEIVEKVHKDGSLKEEMILVCNSLRNDLLHSNEFLRARTLKLVSRLQYKEVLTSLMQAILENLTHRHPYVRRNSVMCIHAIYKKFGDEFIPDIVEKTMAVLEHETDLSTRRNALLLLFEADVGTAIKYLQSNLLNEEESSTSILGDAQADILQLVVLENLRKICQNNPQEKYAYIKMVSQIANTSKNASVLFESAQTLVQLTTSAHYLKLAVQTYIKLLNDQSAENNIKLLILQKLSFLKKLYGRWIQEQVLDILRALSCPADEVRQMTLELVQELTTQRNVEEILKILKKELLSVQRQEEAKNYRQDLIKIIHSQCKKFPELVKKFNLVDILLENYMTQNENEAKEVALLLQDVVNLFQDIRDGVIKKLGTYLNDIKSSSVFRIIL